MEALCDGEEVAQPDKYTVQDFLNVLNKDGYHDLCNYQCPPVKIPQEAQEARNLFEILDRTSGSKLHQEFIRCFSDGFICAKVYCNRC